VKSYPLLRLKHEIATDWTRIASIGVVILVVALTVALTGFLTPALAASPLADHGGADTTIHSVGVRQDVRTTTTNDTTAYDPGEPLENQGTYPLNDTEPPVVTATAEGQRATITNLSLVLRYAVATRERPDDPFYERSTVLQSVEPDAATASVQARLPIADVFARMDALQREFGTQAEVRATLHTRVTYAYATPAAGANSDSEGATAGTRTASVRVGGPVERTEKLYHVPHGTQRQTHRTGADGPTRSATASLVNWLAVLVALLAAIGLVATKATVSRIDPDRVERALQRRRFEEWVTEIDSYTPQGNSHVVDVKSLGDLVDLAIDTQHRVLSPEDMDEYLVVDDDVVFRYAPSSGTRSALQFGFAELETAIPAAPAEIGGRDDGAPGTNGVDGEAVFDTDGEDAPFGISDDDEPLFGDDEDGDGTVDTDELDGDPSSTRTDDERPFGNDPDED
jgi:hypothetical protein